MAELVRRNFFWRYRAILFSVLIFLICTIGVLIPTVYGSKQIADLAVSINLGGRQRMLSQRTVKALLALGIDTQRGAARADDLKELAQVVNLFDTTLKGFRDSGIVTGGDGKPVFLHSVKTNEGRRLVSDAYKIWTPYLDKLQPLLKNPDFSDAELTDVVAYAQTSNLKLLGLMNDLTSDLQNSSDRWSVNLRWIQLAGLIVVLLNVLYTVFKSITDLTKSDRALEAAREETKQILGTVKEGLFLIDSKFRLGSEYSNSLAQIMHRDIAPEMPFLPMLEKMVPKDVYDNAKDYIELLFGDRVKEALIASLNPLNQVEVRDATEDTQKLRYLNFNFNRVLGEGGKTAHLLVTVQDETRLVQLTGQLEAAKGEARAEVDVLLKLVNTNSTMLRQFLDNANQGLAQINQLLRDESDGQKKRLPLINNIMRIVHGIKGEAAALNIEVIEGYVHGFEDELAEMRERGKISGQDMVRITVLLDGFYERLGTISSIAEKMTSGALAGRDDDESFVQEFTGSLHNLVARISSDESKKTQCVCELKDITQLPRPVANELHSIAVQLLRNAVKHGIEMPDERASKGKPASGEIRVTCSKTGQGEYEFMVRDDGCGIVVDKIRDELVRRKILSSQEAGAFNSKQIVAHLFDSGFSTAKSADRDAGRGVGLDVVAQKIKALHGHLTLNSKEQAFTEFKIHFAV